jgi:7-cyano-7-deazaguanine synthase
MREFSAVEVITFDYGQKHCIELESAKTISDKAGVIQSILPINTFSFLGGSALTDHNIPVINAIQVNQLPNTFVPGRNLIFLTYAAALAYQKGIHHLVGGMCQTDYSGYPDCRDHTMKAIEQAIQLGLDYQITIHTPLMFFTKAEIWKLAYDLGCLDTVKEHSHSCYNGVKGGCGNCNACILREKGLREFEESMKLV